MAVELNHLYENKNKTKQKSEMFRYNTFPGACFRGCLMGREGARLRVSVASQNWRTVQFSNLPYT